MIVKILLIASVLVVAWWLLRGPGRGGRLAATRLAGLFLAGGAVVAILAPNAVTRVANFVGVGRGADLVLYVLVVVFTFVCLGQYQQFRRLEEKLARLTRAHALLEHEVEGRHDSAVGRDR